MIIYIIMYINIEQEKIQSIKRKNILNEKQIKIVIWNKGELV